ncbi:MAG: cytochrome c3 family protein [Acidobacteria bacterium]|nr:cytochrome c3 family protein [Acidobacteriota bacterium]
MPEPGDLATFPKEAKCMSCHIGIKTDSPAIRKLAEFYKNQKPVPWVRVYRIPEYVFFSHKEHRRAKVGCESCHGPVAEREVIAAEKPTSMVACMDCHERTGASNACNFCHNP